MRDILKKHIYPILRYSSLYPLYLKFFRPAIYADYKNELGFYKSIIDGASIVFDIGANVGDKSSIFSKFCQSLITVDPDASNYRILKKRFSANPKVKVINAAVSDKIGEETFYSSSPGSPANTLSSKWKDILENPAGNRWNKKLEFSNAYTVETLTLDHLIKLYGVPHYIKIDVEGYESIVLKGLSNKIPVISLEANFPDFRLETLECASTINNISKETTYNIVHAEGTFLWEENKDYEFTANWLKNTELRYFEVFAFTNSKR